VLIPIVKLQFVCTKCHNKRHILYIVNGWNHTGHEPWLFVWWKPLSQVVSPLPSSNCPINLNSYVSLRAWADYSTIITTGKVTLVPFYQQENLHKSYSSHLSLAYQRIRKELLPQLLFVACKTPWELVSNYFMWNLWHITDQIPWQVQLTKNCIKSIQNRSSQLIYNSTNQIWFQKALGLLLPSSAGPWNPKRSSEKFLTFFSYCRPDLDASNQDVTVYNQPPNPPHLRDRGCDHNLSRMHWSTQDIIQQVGAQVVFILVLADFRPVLGCIVLINQTTYLCRWILNFRLVPYPVSVQLWLTGSHHSRFEPNLNQLEHAACWNQTLWTMPGLTPVLGSLDRWITQSHHWFNLNWIWPCGLCWN
jgi:hypothetical protein